MSLDKSANSFAKVLATVETLPWNQSLYLPADDTAWSLDSLAVVWDQGEVEEGEEIPIFPASLGMKRVLSISDVQDIVTNRK